MLVFVLAMLRGSHQEHGHDLKPSGMKSPRQRMMSQDSVSPAFAMGGVGDKSEKGMLRVGRKKNRAN
jgi:hypothetical protein